MKLYFSPGACSLHPHIALREVGVPFELVRVDLRSHKVAGAGDDYYGVNPKGYVPLLELDDGARLTEGVVIDQYVADRNPASGFLPAAGTMERYRAHEWLNFIATELHKQFSPLFYPNTPDETKAQLKARIASRFELVAKTLEKQPFLLGDTFTAPDAYLFNMLTWTGHVGIDRMQWPALVAFYDRVAARPSVQAALEAEKAAH